MPKQSLTVELLAKDAPKDTKEAQYYLDKKLLKVFLGEKKKLSLAKIRRTLSDVNWKDITEENVEIKASGFNSEESEAAYEMIALKSWLFDKYKSKASARAKQIKKITLKNSKTKISKERDKLIEAIKYCRDVVSSNASEINAGEMERLAKAIAKKSSNIKVKVIDAKAAKQLGMGCLLAVGAESIANSEKDFHPRLVVMEFTPNKKASEHIALVGKGITFDTGGLCLKPTQYMLDMKSDMAGAATVLSIFKAIADIGASKFNKKITGVMALTENAFGASSYKPGDVLKAMNGKTVEVVDTDAEGRLALADALSYVSEKVNPDKIIDLATLTGSIVATLGEIAAGAMSSDDDFCNELQKSFSEEGENIWQMPLYPEYKKIINSPIADMKHCNTRPDALVAGLFLKEFVGDIKQSKETKQIPWVHLDIAGVGFIENDGLWAYKGATGFGVKGIINYLKS